MTKHGKMLWVMGAILLMIGGVAVASNMGFKFVPNIATADPEVYWISIPLNNNYTDLASIYNDITAECPNGAAQAVRVHPDQSQCIWNGPFSCNEPYLPGEAVYVSTAVSGCTTWVIVGSHNPSFVYNFPTADPDIYTISVPYHTTLTDIAGLYNELGPNALQVVRVHPDQSQCIWNGPFSCNEPITIGEGYYVSVSVAGTTWTPSHY